MNWLSRGRSVAVVLVALAALAAPALSRSEPAPSAQIRFSGGSVAFLAGINWGGGKLIYHGKTYDLKVSGLSVGAIGATKFEATGTVYNLHQVSDIEGTYSGANASMTAGGGAGAVVLKNSKGVEIRAQSTSAGLKLSAAGSGVVIELKN
jgi:hypothetical protein